MCQKKENQTHFLNKIISNITKKNNQQSIYNTNVKMDTSTSIELNICLDENQYDFIIVFLLFIINI